MVFVVKSLRSYGRGVRLLRSGNATRPSPPRMHEQNGDRIAPISNPEKYGWRAAAGANQNEVAGGLSAFLSWGTPKLLIPKGTFNAKIWSRPADVILPDVAMVLDGGMFTNEKYLHHFGLGANLFTELPKAFALAEEKVRFNHVSLTFIRDLSIEEAAGKVKELNAPESEQGLWKLVDKDECAPVSDVGQILDEVRFQIQKLPPKEREAVEIEITRLYDAIVNATDEDQVVSDIIRLSSEVEEFNFLASSGTRAQIPREGSRAYSTFAATSPLLKSCPTFYVPLLQAYGKNLREFQQVNYKLLQDARANFGPHSDEYDDQVNYTTEDSYAIIPRHLPTIAAALITEYDPTFPIPFLQQELLNLSC